MSESDQTTKLKGQQNITGLKNEQDDNSTK